MPDDEIIRKCLNDEDGSAWEGFVRDYSRVIWGAIHRTFHACSFAYSPQDTEDVFSCVYLSLIENDFRKLRQFRGENACSLSTWLSVIAVRKSIDYVRKDKSRFFAEPVEGDRDIFA